MSEMNSNVNIQRTRTVKEVVTHNFGLKLLSVIFAILLWFYVVNETNPIKVRHYDNITISIVGKEELTAQKLIPLESLRSILPQAKVSLNVPHSEISTISAANIEVTLDLSGISAPGKYQVPLKVKSGNADVTVASFSPTSIEVVIDELASAVVPVRLSTIGKLPDDLYKGVAQTDPETLQISGPESYISCITRAQIEVDLSTMSDGYSASMQYVFLDKDGNPVSGENIDANREVVLVDMGILSKKTVPLEFMSCLKNVDKMAEGYSVAEVSSSLESVTIIGDGATLENINRIFIEDVDMTGIGPETTSMDAVMIVPEGVQLLDAKQPVLSFDIAEKQISKELLVDIEYVCNPEYTVVSDVLQAKVTVNGGYFSVANMEPEDISVKADTTALEAGLSTVKLNITLKDVDPLLTVTAEPDSVQVTLVLQEAGDT